MVTMTTLTLQPTIGGANDVENLHILHDLADILMWVYGFHAVLLNFHCVEHTIKMHKNCRFLSLIQFSIFKSSNSSCFEFQFSMELSVHQVLLRSIFTKLIVSSSNLQS